MIRMATVEGMVEKVAAWLDEWRTADEVAKLIGITRVEAVVVIGKLITAERIPTEIEYRRG